MMMSCRSDYERSFFEVDFSESANVEESQVTKAPEVYNNLEEVSNSVVKILYSGAFDKQREEEREKIAEMHRQREALEAQLAATNEDGIIPPDGIKTRIMGGRFGGRNRVPTRGRLGFGTSELPTTSSSETPKSKTSKNRSERPSTTTATKTTTKATTKQVVKATTTQRPAWQGSRNRCFVCDASSAVECKSTGEEVTCNRGEACQTEFRWENGLVKIQSTCKQKNACMVMISQNENCKRLKGQVGVNRTCWRCCTGDLCNKSHLDPEKV